MIDNYLMLNLEHAKLKGFSTSNRGRSSTIKIEIETADADTFSWLLHNLQEFQTGQKQRDREEVKETKRAALPAPRFALPAPLLQLPAPKERYR